MRTYKSRIIMHVISLLCAFILTAFTASAETDFGSKISLETHLEERLRAAITEIIGSDKVIVAVNADVEAGKRQSSGGGAGRRGVLKQKEGSDALVLPGVPAKKEIGKSPTQTAELSLPDAPSGAGSAMVRRLAVTILLDSKVPAALLETVKDVAANIVDFNQGRGDRLDIKQVDIKKMNFQWGSLFYPPHLYWLVLVFMGSFFLIAASLFLLNPFIKLSGSGQSVKVDVLKDVAAGILSKGGEAASEVAAEVPVAGAAGAMTQEEKTFQPFSFIRDRHLRDLSFILKNEPALDIAIISNYMDTDLAIKLFEYFSEEKQAEIAVCLSRIEEVNPDKIQAIEEKIKARLGYLIGGEDKVANILDFVTDEVRDKVFNLMEKKDAGAAQRLRQKIKDLDAFMREMPTQGIQTLYRQMDHSLFAQILKAMPEDIQKRVSESLTAGAAELLKQEMDLSKALPAVRMKKERHNMMLIIRKMIREGSLEMGNN
ncbi:MAG: hypothetical protein HZA17_03950 [Nitrospirae bacterium]|nr:hypothetical protein [Nitrospirota bacterium]